MDRSRFFLISSLLFLVLALCDSLEEEGMALLRFKKGVEFDPYEALSNWGKPGVDHCLWYGVNCSDDGRVVSLILRDLCLEGTLTSEIRKLVNLKSLVLHNNSLSGTIPGEMIELSKLEVLDLGQNNFLGPFPLELLGLASLKILDISNNRLKIPSEFLELYTLPECQVGEDMLCTNRRSLKVSIESATVRRLLLESINPISRTREFETVPSPLQIHSPSPSPSPSLSQTHPPSPSPSPSPSRSQSPLTLAIDPPYLALSPEMFGKPSAPPPSHLLHKLGEGFPIKSQSAKTDENKKKSHWVIFVSVGAGMLFLTAAAYSIYLLYSRSSKVVSVMPWKTGLSGQLQKALVTGVPSLKRSELETACEDFSNIITTLSGFSFYKGTLSSGVEIGVTSSLIKSAKDWPDQSEVLFRKKISELSIVNHKNFMNLIGYCVEQSPFTRMMVYEYAPNGTLFEHLHIKEAEPLDWITRLRVAMGIAYCLDHMQRLDPPIILRSLNSSIVFLTEDYAAKISDLSFWNEEKNTDLSSESPDDSEPPLMNQEDVVYKFGIILLELISGRLPFSKDDGLLVLWASSYLTGKRPLNGIVDLTLKSVKNDDIIAYCDVIRSCVDHDPRKRSTMADVVSQLKQITSMSADAASPKLSPLWWAELEIISSESA